MIDIDDLQLKMEIDEIMKSVDSIMKKVEIVLPMNEEEANPQND